MCDNSNNRLRATEYNKKKNDCSIVFESHELPASPPPSLRVLLIYPCFAFLFHVTCSPKATASRTRVLSSQIVMWVLGIRIGEQKQGYYLFINSYIVVTLTEGRPVRKILLLL